MDQEHNAVAVYFRNIRDAVVSTCKGMALTLRYFFRPKVTMAYPEERPAIPASHRGMHVYDEDACTICRACENVCPVQCITIDALGKGRSGMVTSYRVDYSKCLFCNLCSEACAPECLSMGPEYDLGTLAFEDCTIEFSRHKSPEERVAFEAELARKEAERKAKAAAAKPAAGADTAAPPAATPTPNGKDTP